MASALAAGFILSSCDDVSELPSTQVFMLVDVSKTWHNESEDYRNASVLSEVGFGASLAAQKVNAETGRPVSLQTRIIGANSLERVPVCDVIYRKTLIKARENKSYELSSPHDLNTYFGRDCVSVILKIPAENRTEISNSLASVANQPSIGASNRKIVIVSDFLEDAVAPAAPLSLKGFQVVMLYRPLPQDQTNPLAMQQRIAAWKGLFESLGAEAFALPDTGIKREVVAELLTKSAGPKAVDQAGSKHE